MSLAFSPVGKENQLPLPLPLICPPDQLLLTGHRLAVTHGGLEELLELGLVLRRDEGEADVGDLGAGGLGRRLRLRRRGILERLRYLRRGLASWSRRRTGGHRELLLRKLQGRRLQILLRRRLALGGISGELRLQGRLETLLRWCRGGSGEASELRLQRLSTWKARGLGLKLPDAESSRLRRKARLLWLLTLRELRVDRLLSERRRAGAGAVGAAQVGVRRRVHYKTDAGIEKDTERKENEMEVRTTSSGAEQRQRTMLETTTPRGGFRHEERRRPGRALAASSKAGPSSLPQSS